MRFREQKMKADVHWRTWLRMRRGSIALPWNRPRTARCCLTPWAESAVRSDRLYFFTLPQA